MAFSQMLTLLVVVLALGSIETISAGRHRSHRHRSSRSSHHAKRTASLTKQIVSEAVLITPPTSPGSGKFGNDIITASTVITASTSTASPPPPPKKKSPPPPKKAAASPPPKKAATPPTPKKAATPPSPSGSPDIFTFKTCPTTPLQHCDFFLSGSPLVVPTFTLKKLYHNSFISSKALFSGKTFQPVHSANSGGSCFFVPEYATGPKCGKSFLFNGTTTIMNAKYIEARTLINSHIKDFANSCVVIPIHAAMIVATKATAKANTTYVTIKPNDGNKTYPPLRRCVVFKTKLL